MAEMDAETLLKLPKHLLDRIRAILVENVKLPSDLKQTLRTAVENAESSTSALAARLPWTSEVQTTSVDQADSQTEDPNAPSGQSRQDEVIPPTIPLEHVELLAKWASTRAGERSLERAKLDPHDYSLISLLAGTEVYIPAHQLAMLKLSERRDAPNPYLPHHLSPRPPIFAGYRALSKQLTTTLNILFSIFGSGGAVYVAGVTGAGYSREVSVILGVLAGVVVGITELVLVWILVWRVDEGRKGEVRNWQGSHGAGPKAIAGDEGNEGNEGEAGESEVLVEKKPQVRLRRRAIRPDSESTLGQDEPHSL